MIRKLQFIKNVSYLNILGKYFFPSFCIMEKLYNSFKYIQFYMGLCVDSDQTLPGVIHPLVRQEYVLIAQSVLNNC